MSWVFFKFGEANYLEEVQLEDVGEVYGSNEGKVESGSGQDQGFSVFVRNNVHAENRTGTSVINKK